MTNILIIEDDKEINNLLCSILCKEKFNCKSIYSGLQALAALKTNRFDMVLLDLMLPGMPGEKLLRDFRRFSNAPVIIISAKDETAVKVDMLRTGADDYITKPFDNNEVLARVESNLRRSLGYSSPLLIAGSLEIDTEKNVCTVSGQTVSLTGIEIKILRLLMEHPQKLFTKANLYSSVWNEPYDYDDNAVNTHISNLRRKLKSVCPDQEFIETVWGIGYKLACPS
ncbi:MAG TPA: response regulator transcription factor [Clostridia bacterium]|nr:response regulator transcription factor [Clostridia bacterium]